MVDHWDRPGWTAQTRAYYWTLAFSACPALAGLARRCQQHLAPLGLDPVPEDGLHITLTRVGFAVTLPLSSLDDVINAVATAAQVSDLGLVCGLDHCGGGGCHGVDGHRASVVLTTPHRQLKRRRRQPVHLVTCPLHHD